jgi:hypothetical protein
MPKTTLVPTGAWGKLRLMLDPKKFKAKLEKNVRKATKLNAALVEREIRKGIQSGSWSKNAQLTVMFKHSRSPLIGPGDAELFKAITSEMVDSFTAFVGVKRMSGMFNVAAAIHEGSTIAVTPKMRGLFLVLAAASRGEKVGLSGRAKEMFDMLGGAGEIRPLKDSTSTIIIPPRPFIRMAFENPTVKAKIQANWQKAVAATFSVPKGEG